MKKHIKFESGTSNHMVISIFVLIVFYLNLLSLKPVNLN